MYQVDYRYAATGRKLVIQGRDISKFVSLKTEHWVSPVHGPESRPVSRGQGIAELWKRDSKEKITDKSFSYSVIIDS